LPAFGSFIVVDVHGLAEFDAAVRGYLDVEAGTARPGTTVVDVTGKALLPAIEIDSGNALTGFHQGNGNMDGGGGFSRSTFLTSKHDDVRRTGSI
jgi:hypothetical protein